MSPPLGYVVYDGLSLIDGVTPIVVIANGFDKDSSNSKTGAMIQTWILRQDSKPSDAVRTGLDQAICGLCPHRRDDETGDRPCYVNVGQAPNSVWGAWTRGRYIPLATKPFAGRLVRGGAYGDPAAMPTAIWRAVLGGTAGHTMYTHQWLTCDQELRHYAMASVDTEGEAQLARNMGWRTFRVRRPGDPKLDFESVCPASAEAGKKLTCDECLACSGTATGRRGGIVITAHGSPHAQQSHARKFKGINIEVATA